MSFAMATSVSSLPAVDISSGSMSIYSTNGAEMIEVVEVDETRPKAKLVLTAGPLFVYDWLSAQADVSGHDRRGGARRCLTIALVFMIATRILSYSEAGEEEDVG